MVIVFEPTAKEIEPDAEPEVTEVPLTLTVAVLSVTVGVKVIDETEYATEALYEPFAEVKVGESVPDDKPSEESVFTDEAARVTVIV